MTIAMYAVSIWLEPSSPPLAEPVFLRMGKGKSGGKVKGGEYLPLSVYGKRGFDVEAIRQKCKDIEEHELRPPKVWQGKRRGKARAISEGQWLEASAEQSRLP